MTPGQIIYRRRLSAHLTQTELSRRCGIAQPNLAAFERGVRKPSLWSLQRIAKGLDLKPAQLLEDEAPLNLDRFATDKLCRALVSNRRDQAPVPDQVWLDLAAMFHWKLRILFPRIRRRDSRVSINASERRLKAVLGRNLLDEITRRLDKSYPEGGPWR